MSLRTISRGKLLLIILAALAVVTAVAVSGFCAKPVSLYASADGNVAYSFSVTSDYTFNYTFDAGTNSRLPVITLQFNGSATNYSTMSFWYLLSDDGVIDEDEDWAELPVGNYIATTGEGTFYVDSLTGYAADGRFDKYIFFRGGLEGGTGDDDFYIDPTPRLISIEGLSTPSDVYNITEVSASWNGARYDMTTSSPVWAGSAITLTARTNGTDNVNYFYRLGNSDPVPFSVHTDANGSYYGQAVIGGADSAVTAYSGAIIVYSRNRSGTYTNYYTNTHDLYINLDTVQPSFAVSATVPEGSGTAAYSEGSWTDRAVTFRISPTSVISGANYAYYTTDPADLTNLSAAGNEYILKISEEGVTNVTFVATSGSGLRYTSPGHIVRRDSSAPELNVAAADANGTSITSLGTTPGSGAREGYASGGITFTLSNLTAQQSGNTATFSYSADDGANFTVLNPTNGLYTLPLANSGSAVFNGTKYIFRVSLASGLYDEYAFDFAILNGNFYTDMELGVPEANPAGWINEPVTVSFTLPAFLSEAFIGASGTEYDIHGYITGDTSTDVIMEAEISDSPLGAGYKVYTVSVERNLNGQSYSFVIYDRAGNAVRYETDENGNIVTDPDTEETFPLRTGILYLDLVTPGYDVVKTVGSSSIVLEDDGWSAEEVVITITPVVPVSGVNLYIMRSENQPSTETLTMTEDGTYVFTASASGRYGFRLMSGAGNYADIWTEVSIDSAAISYVEPDEPWAAYRMEPDGTRGSEIDYVYESNSYGTVATDILLTFATNQNAGEDRGHFDIFYYDYTAAGSLNDTIDNYTLYDDEYVLNAFPDSFLLTMPDDASRGTLRYAFILRSKAVDSNGTYTYTEVRRIEINYDVTPFRISVTSSYGDSSAWTGSEITFDLSLSDPDNTAKIDIAYYEYRLGDNGAWVGIEPAFGSSVSFTQSFIFGGIKQYVDIPGIDESSGDSSESANFMSYNGNIYFRAVTSAGLASETVGQYIRVDRSTPNALYALDLGSGEIVWDADAGGAGTGMYLVYSSDTSVLLYPRSIDFKAPITFYYNESDANEAPEFMVGANGWQELTTTMELFDGETYWLYALNSVGGTSATVKIHVRLDSTKPPLSVSVSGPSTGAGGGLEFQWTDEAELQLNVTNLTAVNTGVYFEYKMDGSDEWVRLSDTARDLQANGFLSQQIIFRGDGVPEDFVIPGNRINTVVFRVINLGGSSVTSASVVVRIDAAAPDFEPVFETPSLGEVTDLDIWYTEAMTVTIIPAAPANDYGSDVRNPGGVEYFYRVVSGAAGSSDYQRMRGNSFSTDDIVGFTGNGEIEVELRAVSTANDESVSRTYTFKIDKTAPVFDLIGTAIRNDMDAGTILSGTWTNADSVNIAIANRAANESPVIYTYYWENMSSGESNWPEVGGALGTLNRTQMDVLHVTAVSGNGDGIRVERVFEVLIDNTPPVIYAGNIVNNVDDPNNPYRYYIDQVIRYEEANLASAMYNNFPLSNGQIIATNTVDNSNGGYVHIVITDLAGNTAELTFYMTVFPLTVNTITLSDEHRELLDEFTEDFYAAEQGLTDSRRQYFSTLISRLEDRLFMLEKMVEDYQGYLRQVNSQQSFTLVSDYDLMYTYINYFTTEDELTRYPDWLQEEILTGVYSSYYTKLVSQFNTLHSLMIEVLDIEDSVVALPATNVVERTDYQNVIRVYNAYDSLAGDQKAVFTPNLYNKLTELKRICEVLLMQDESTGISIDGDNLVGETNGAMLMVTSYAPESQYFIEAQTTLYNMLTAADSRKILTINRLYLDGEGAQYDTGTITVTLPIPEDYQNYVYFAVYRLSSDGTITRIETSRRTPDGENVTFTTNSLATYILATTANVVVAETPEKVYGSIAGIEIDGTLLTYITYSVVAMFVVFVIIIIAVALRRRKFLQNYNRDHKKALVRRGIRSIPKGNAPPPSNPARPEERVGHEPNVYYRKK